MGIRFQCPNGHKLNVKAFQAGRRGICPHCGVGVDIPHESGVGSDNEGPVKKGGGARAEDAARPGVLRPIPIPPSDLGGLAQIPPSLATTRGPMAQHEVSGHPLGATTDATGDPDAGAFAGQDGNRQEAALGPLDPLSEAPDVVWYLRPPSGGQYGPATQQVMRVWLAEGRVTPDCEVWREGWRDWRVAADVFPESAFPQLRPPDAIPGLDAILTEPVGKSSGQAGYGPARRASLFGQILIIVSLFAVGAGILAVIYYWVRSS
jgi:GYF domain 2